MLDLLGAALAAASLVRKVFFHDDHKVVVPVYHADDFNLATDNGNDINANGAIKKSEDGGEY